MKEPIWIPSEERIKSSNMFAYLKYAEKISGKKFKNYNELYKWSVSDIKRFWKSIWDISEIKHSSDYDFIVSKDKMPDSKWFGGAKLNFAENLLRYKDDHIAIISTRENAPTVRLTYNQLYNLVAKCAYSLRQLGLKEGDRVAGFVTNTPEAIIAMLATTSIGAIWSSCSPDFGTQAVLDRFSQIEPKIVFASEEYSYNGKVIDCKQKIESVVDNVPSIQRVFLIPRFNDFSGIEKDNSNLLKKTKKYLYINELFRNTSTEIEFNQLSFDHPVYIMFSSGTTGKPKCIVHGAGGTLLQHFKELSLHTNVSRSDTITYYTTCGWMMWNWLMSSLILGATVFLYEGSPVYPNVEALWEKIESEKITVFGTSPKFIKICEDSSIKLKNEFDLSSLKTILSTGSPLPGEKL